MALTEAQKHLIVGLRLFSVEKDAIVGIVSALQKPEQQDEMMEWMGTHQEATVPDLLRKTAEIVNRKQNKNFRAISTSATPPLSNPAIWRPLPISDRHGRRST